MKKKVKITLIVVLILWIALIVFDCIRLNSSYKYKKPLITIASIDYEDGSRYGTIYIGLGYSVDNYAVRNVSGFGKAVNVFYVFTLPYFEKQ